MNLKGLIFNFLFIFLFSCSFVNKKDVVLSSVDTNSDEYDIYNDEGYNKVSDPFEKMNRKVFNFNMFLLSNIVSPTVVFYGKVTNKFIRDGLYNISSRFYDFPYLINSILQLDFKNSFKTVATFSINMTFGFFGFFNVADNLGIYRDERTFGQTLGKYGIGNGPFLMLPFFGPYTFREGIGSFTDMSINPFSLNLVGFDHKHSSITPSYVNVVSYIGRYGVKLEDVINLNDNFLKKSFDPYIFMRDSYIQNINYKLKKGE